MISLSKKIMTVILALAAVICLFFGASLYFKPAAAAEEVTESVVLKDIEDFTYTESSGGYVLTGLKPAGIEKIGKNNFSIDLTGLNVTQLGADGATGSFLTSEFIGKLTGITFAADLIKIGPNAFKGCTGLTAIDLSAAVNLTSIGANAFDSNSNSAVDAITVPAKVAEIGNLAFANHKKLTKINFFAENANDFYAVPNNLTAETIAYAAQVNPFRSVGINGNGVTVNIGRQEVVAAGVSALVVKRIPSFMFAASQQYPNKITNVNFDNVEINAESAFGAGAFGRCTTLTQVVIPGSVNVIGKFAFWGCSSITNATIASGVTTIDTAAFKGCTALQNVTLPEGLEFINSEAFSGCNAFTEITIPESVKNIGTSAFANCANVRKINYFAIDAKGVVSSPFVNSGKDVEVVIGKPGDGANKITYIQGHLFRATNITKVTLYNVGNKAQGTSFGVNVFEGCTALTSVIFDNSCEIEVLNSYTFKDCTALTSVRFPDASNSNTTKINVIGENAFENCSALAQIDLAGVKTIKANAFSGCGMYKIEIPESVEEIAVSAFTNCDRLYEVVYNGTHDFTASFPKGVRFLKLGDNSFISDNGSYVCYSDTSTQVARNILITYKGKEETVDLSGLFDGGEFLIGKQAFKNNDEVRKIIVPAKVNEIGAEAFAGCTALTELVLPESISVIPESMCEGCVSLTEIAIPSNITGIGAHAFDGCTSLKSLTFKMYKAPEGSGGDDKDGFKLVKIDMYAFNNCSALAVVEIPESVTSIGAHAFDGCARLSTVYLPARLDSYNNSAIFGGSANLILIAPFATYENYSQSFSQYGTVTYLVNLNLYNVVDKETDTESKLVGSEYRLHGYTYDFVMQSNKSWAKTGGMPVQSGYKASVWYTSPGLDEKYLFTTLNGDLQSAGINERNLYAYYFEKPRFEVVDVTPQYTGSDISDILKDFENNNPFIDESTRRFTIEIGEYRNVAGEKVEKTSNIQDAGTYSLILALSLPDRFGVWETEDSISFTFTVLPQYITVNDELIWKSGSSDLDSGTLYFYEDRVPYSRPQDNMTLVDTISVNNSYVIYTGSGKPTVYLADSTQNHYKIKSYGESDGVELAADGKGLTVINNTPGTYEAEVTIIADNNFRLQRPIDSNDNSGIVWTEMVTAEGYRYTLVKTWYIAVTASNPLVIGNSIYDLPETKNPTDGDDVFKGWFFGDKNELAKPTLALTDGQENGNVTFELSCIEVWGNSDPINIAYNQYSDYVNTSMPVGHYLLKVSVKKIDVYADYERVFEFEVRKAQYEDKLQDWGIKPVPTPGDTTGKPTYNIWGELWTGAGEKESFIREYTDGGVQFADTSSVDILKLESEDIYDNRQGEWSKSVYNKLFSKFEISYNLDGLSNYYTEKEFENGPRMPGKYTVYFNISSPNYVSFVDTAKESDRLEYCYTLYIKRMIDVDAIDLGELVYSGNVIKFNDTDYYKFVYLNGSDDDAVHAAAAVGKTDEYVHAGTHTVALMIRKDLSDSYAWKGGNETVVYADPDNGDQVFAIREFEIKKARNESTQALSIREWTWGEEANEPQWATRFVTDKNQYVFRLRSTTDSSKTYYYNPKEAGQKSFDEADAGEYVLTATAPGGDDYDWDNNGDYTVTYPYIVVIEKATLTLKTQPYMESWRYGDFDTGYVTPEFAFSDEYSSLMAKFYIVTRAEYEKFVKGELEKEDMSKYIDVDFMLDALGEVPVGNYTLVFELDEETQLGDNYYEWSYAVHFDVIKARNFWEVTPSVHDWVYGNYDVRETVLDYTPHYGNKNSVILSYRSEFSGWETDITKLGLDVNGELAVGKYEFRAYLPGTDDYEDLELILSFNVTKANNSWLDDGIPSVISWSQGRWNASENSLQAKSNYGTVEFSVYAADDTERENKLDINNLNALNVGSYVLVAYVAGNDDYNELVSETTFAVFEDSVGMTGIIAATVVFAVIAIGLAVSGVVLLILRNKKIEEEFRRMIKSELRRK